MQQRFANILDNMTNLLDQSEIENKIDDFFIHYANGLKTIYSTYFSSVSSLSIAAFNEELREELRDGCFTFINNKYPKNELNNYLFYIANSFAKKTGVSNKSKIEYICPGCVFLGKDYSILEYDKLFKCDECEFEFKSNNLPPEKTYFFNTFYRHNKNGYRCPECQRFIPHPLDNNGSIKCPYFDCIFTGLTLELDKMHHPTSKSDPEKLILDTTNDFNLSLKDKLISNTLDAHSKLEFTEQIKQKTNTIKEIIESQSNSVVYNSSNATIKHKQLIYQSILLLLDMYPIEMIEYLSGHKDNYFGFQHKIFQKYIELLEQSFPFAISKNGKSYRINSLLDNELGLFDGISVFEAPISNKFVVKNMTKEIYIGGRKASYARPYYIGKLLNIVDKNTHNSLLSNVVEYSFSKILLNQVQGVSTVIVSHLRTPPHYQMGGMAHINRIRKKIVERVLCDAVH